METLKRIALHPLTILLCMSIGMLFGLQFPGFSGSLSVLGEIYLDLMKMIVLPFMVSAVILSMQRLIRDGGSGRLFARVLATFFALSLAAAVLGGLAAMVMQPGSNLSRETLDSFGDIVGEDIKTHDVAIEFRGAPSQTEHTELNTMLLNLVPENVFAALASGSMLKVLVFSLLMGVAVSQVQWRFSEHFCNSLETLYQSCLFLMGWLIYLLPIVLFAMTAGQVAEGGLAPLVAMGKFVLTLAAGSLAMVILAVGMIYLRASKSFWQVLQSLRDPFALALATRNSVICMPAMVESLNKNLGFPLERVELLVPLSVSLLRIGPMIYYMCATLFIAQLYDQTLALSEMPLLLAASIMAGFASAGMTGLATASLTGMVCAYLGLPFEAAFVLFIAVDPICDIIRTLTLVIANMAAVAIIAESPGAQSDTEALATYAL